MADALFFQCYAENLHRFGDILDLLLAQRFETEGKLLLDLLGHLPGDTDAAGLRQLLEAGGNIDPVAVTVVTVDYHLAKIYSDPDQDLLGLGKRRIALG